MPPLKQRAPHRVKVLGRRLSVAAGPAHCVAAHDAVRSCSRVRSAAAPRRCSGRCMAHPSVLRPGAPQGRQLLRRRLRTGLVLVPGPLPAAVRREGCAPAARADDASRPAATTSTTRTPPPASPRTCPTSRCWSCCATRSSGRTPPTSTSSRAASRRRPSSGRSSSRTSASSQTWTGCSRDPHYFGYSHRHHSYRRRGQYAEQLQRFVDLLGRDRLHVVDSARFFDAPRGGVLPGHRLPRPAQARRHHLRPLERPARAPRCRPGRRASCARRSRRTTWPSSACWESGPAGAGDVALPTGRGGRRASGPPPSSWPGCCSGPERVRAFAVDPGRSDGHRDDRAERGVAAARPEPLSAQRIVRSRSTPTRRSCWATTVVDPVAQVTGRTRRAGARRPVRHGPSL